MQEPWASLQKNLFPPMLVYPHGDAFNVVPTQIEPIIQMLLYMSACTLPESNEDKETHQKGCKR